jgi:hypothetical protein
MVRMFAGEIISVHIYNRIHTLSECHRLMTPLHTMGPRPFSMYLSLSRFLFLDFCFSLSLSLSFFFTQHVSLLLFLMEILSPIPKFLFVCYFSGNFSVLLFNPAALLWL